MSILKSLMGVSLAAVMATTAHAENIAITGGTAFTDGGKGKVENATVLIADGKVVSVTAGGDVPGGYRTVDAKGKWVTTGFMVSSTQLGLGEIELSGDLDDARADKAQHTIGLDPINGFNPDTTLIPITRIEGVTRAVVHLTGGKDMWMGQGMVIDLGDEADQINRDPAFIGLNVTAWGARSGGGSRPAMWDAIYSKLDAADPRGKKADKKDEKAKKDVDALALERLFAHKESLLVAANRKADILKVIGLKERYGFDVILIGGDEAWRVADKLAAAKVPVVLNPMENLPDSFDDLAATGTNAARLTKAGVTVAFVGPDTHNARNVVQAAGNAVAMGMSWADAVDALTVNPAKIFGIDKSYGTLTKGKDADVVVWDGDPLEVMSSPDALFIKGEQVALKSRQTELRDRYIKLVRSPEYRRPK
ncbi:amidohydrolase family protein [Kordiimonas marina]|uniref:amidohydrolase family protein n=1 Tax=Kordiimonas marina TaxID=2872312 RepID=UPI001FF1FC74|nr:amidohydrolase family protein [Kordiimonas marina]MCJ9428526.1 amidohydrolase family protein [Kordiimonas marina]